MAQVGRLAKRPRVCENWRKPAPSYRSGVCHNCESGLIEGELANSPEPLDPPAEGNALIC